MTETARHSTILPWALGIPSRVQAECADGNGINAARDGRRKISQFESAKPGNGSRGSNHAEPQDLVVSKRKVIIVLQFVVGSIVTLGGTFFTLLAVNPLGTALGSTHLFLGISGILVGIHVLRRRTLPRRLLLVVNLAIIAYSLVSVGLAVAQSLLPSPALHDSLVGTTIAVTLMIIIIYLLPKA